MSDAPRRARTAVAARRRCGWSAATPTPEELAAAASPCSSAAGARRGRGTPPPAPVSAWADRARLRAAAGRPPARPAGGPRPAAADRPRPWAAGHCRQSRRRTPGARVRRAGDLHQLTLPRRARAPTSTGSPTPTSTPSVGLSPIAATYLGHPRPRRGPRRLLPRRPSPPSSSLRRRTLAALDAGDPGRRHRPGDRGGDARAARRWPSRSTRRACDEMSTSTSSPRRCRASAASST